MQMGFVVSDHPGVSVVIGSESREVGLLLPGIVTFLAALKHITSLINRYK